jgi:DNA-binding NarL/FixJ family response regulator
MEVNPAFARSEEKYELLKRARRESWIILGILLFVGIFTGADIISDLGEGAPPSHLIGEGAVAIMSLIGASFLWRRTTKLRKEVIEQRDIALKAETGRVQAVQEALKWKAEASNAIRGLSDAIDAQMIRWQLTNAEKEVALLLLKGLSLKEIAEVRGVSEKTARAQSFSIYSKSGLGGRAELSAFFLEDLMLPSLGDASTASMEIGSP